MLDEPRFFQNGNRAAREAKAKRQGLVQHVRRGEATIERGQRAVEIGADEPIDDPARSVVRYHRHEPGGFEQRDRRSDAVAIGLRLYHKFDDPAGLIRAIAIARETDDLAAFPVELLAGDGAEAFLAQFDENRPGSFAVEGTQGIGRDAAENK